MSPTNSDCRTKLKSPLFAISAFVLLVLMTITVVVVVLAKVPQSSTVDNVTYNEENATEKLNFTKFKSNRHLVRSRGNLDEDDEDDFALNPLEINVDTIYTPWTKWSRCKKKCKQVRKRFCKSSSICGNNILKEERPCDRGRCHRRRKKDNFHIVRKKKLSQRTRGVLKFNRAFLTRWSRWSPCSETCKTIRSRRCLFSLVCGFSVINEEAYCYTDGSTCEKWYKEGTYPRPSPFGPETTNEADLEATVEQEQVEVHSRDAGSQNEGEKQCGIQHIESEQQTPPWALRIIGGREAARGRWSWQVAILNKYREVFCGGTLVAPGWVLTAAHCIRKHMFVRLGEHDLIVKEGTEIEYSVLSVIQHPDYNADTVDNDIALIRIPVGNEDDSSGDHGSVFDSDMDVTRNGRKIQNYSKGRGKSSRKNKKSGQQFSTACLPDQNEVLPEYDSAHCTIVGWGKEKNTHAYGTEVLHEAEIPIVSEKECLNVYRDYYISKNMFCAGYKGGRVDSCAGDSGGPLLCQNQQGYWTIYGITSFGEGCGQRYGIYSKVPNYTNWIRGVIKNSQ